jgi:hypothetical protein
VFLIDRIASTEELLSLLVQLNNEVKTGNVIEFSFEAHPVENGFQVNAAIRAISLN